jgi:hypothetical protein
MNTLLFVITFLFVISISLLIYIIKLITNQVSFLLQEQSDNHKIILNALSETQLFLKNYIDTTQANILNEIHVDYTVFFNKIDTHTQTLVTQFEQAKTSFSDIELKNIERNDLILKNFSDIHKNMKEHEKISEKLMVSTTSRDILSKAYLKELSERTDSLKRTTEMIYNDFDLLLELLKAGLMNDLIKDLKKKMIDSKHLS